MRERNNHPTAEAAEPHSSQNGDSSQVSSSFRSSSACGGGDPQLAYIYNSPVRPSSWRISKLPVKENLSARHSSNSEATLLRIQARFGKLAEEDCGRPRPHSSPVKRRSKRFRTSTARRVGGSRIRKCRKLVISGSLPCPPLVRDQIERWKQVRRSSLESSVSRKDGRLHSLTNHERDCTEVRVVNETEKSSFVSNAAGNSDGTEAPTSQTSSPTASAAQSSKRSSQSYKRRKKRREDFSDVEDEESQKKNESAPSSKKEYACPFFKAWPRSHMGCKDSGWVDQRKVKDHLKRKHYNDKLPPEIEHRFLWEDWYRYIVKDTDRASRIMPNSNANFLRIVKYLIRASEQLEAQAQDAPCFGSCMLKLFQHAQRNPTAAESLVQGISNILDRPYIPVSAENNGNSNNDAAAAALQSDSLDITYLPSDFYSSCTSSAEPGHGSQNVCETSNWPTASGADSFETTHATATPMTTANPSNETSLLEANQFFVLAATPAAPTSNPSQDSEFWLTPLASNENSEDFEDWVRSEDFTVESSVRSATDTAHVAMAAAAAAQAQTQNSGHTLAQGSGCCEDVIVQTSLHHPEFPFSELQKQFEHLDHTNGFLNPKVMQAPSEIPTIHTTTASKPGSGGGHGGRHSLSLNLLPLSSSTNNQAASHIPDANVNVEDVSHTTAAAAPEFTFFQRKLKSPAEKRRRSHTERMGRIMIPSYDGNNNRLHSLPTPSPSVYSRTTGSCLQTPALLTPFSATTTASSSLSLSTHMILVVSGRRPEMFKFSGSISNSIDGFINWMSDNFNFSFAATASTTTSQTSSRSLCFMNDGVMLWDKKSVLDQLKDFWSESGEMFFNGAIPWFWIDMPCGCFHHMNAASNYNLPYGISADQTWIASPAPI